MHPKKFQNKTNGVTPRRWIKCANPNLSTFYDTYLGKNSDWAIDFNQVAKLKENISNNEIRKQWVDIKQQCKNRLAQWVKAKCGIVINNHSLFDIMVEFFF